MTTEPRFRQDNTEGYSDEELAALNAELERRMHAAVHHENTWQRFMWWEDMEAYIAEDILKHPPMRTTHEETTMSTARTEKIAASKSSAREVTIMQRHPTACRC